MEEENGIKTDAKGRFMPGTAPGPGRPKGSKSMKQFAREYLMSLPDDDKKQFLNDLDPSIVWRMAEGNPANDINVDGEIRLPLYLPTELLKKNDIPQIAESDRE